MMSDYFYSLRFKLPAIILLMSFASIAVVFWVSFLSVKEELIADRLKELNAQISTLQADLDDSLSSKHYEKARERLLLAALLPNIKSILLADESNKVLIASRNAWRQQPAEQVNPSFDSKLAYLTRILGVNQQQVIAEHELAVTQIISVYYPVRLGQLSINSLRPTVIGTLYVEYDLTLPLAKARQTAWYEALRLAGLNFSVALILVMLLERQIRCRLGELEDMATRLQNGRLDYRVKITGRDEISKLGQTLNTMAQRWQDIEADLKIAKQEADKANQAKSAFLAKMSHEIRTPMNGIMGMTHFLLSSGLGSQQKQYAGIIARSADTLLSLINDILDLSKIEAKKFTLEQRAFDLEQAIEEVIEMVAFRAQEKSLDLAYFIGSDVPARVIGDKDRLKQILLNLCGNAIKFTAEGQVTITLESEMLEPELFKVNMVIRDTGEGIPKSKQSSLFQPFRQLSSQQAQQSMGTGLGLYISRQLARLMGGDINLVSEPGQGATFTVSIPFKEASVVQSSVQIQLTGYTVLILETQAASRQFLQERIELWGGHCLTTDSVENGLQILKEQQTHETWMVFVEQRLLYELVEGETLLDYLEQNAIKRIELLAMNQVRDEQNLDHTQVRVLYKPLRGSYLQDAFADLLQLSRERSHQENLAESLIDSALAQQFNILLAEDNAINQIVVLEYLKKLGFRTDVAQNGLEVLEKVKTNSYDLVLMDCQMPEMDGFEATRKIRNGEAGMDNKNIVVVAVTAYAYQEDQDKCFAAGMDDFVTKPIKSEAISKVLAKWLSRSDRLNNSE